MWSKQKEFEKGQTAKQGEFPLSSRSSQPVGLARAAVVQPRVYLYHEPKGTEDEAPVAALLPPVLDPRRRAKTSCERPFPYGWTACCPAEVESGWPKPRAAHLLQL